MLAPMARFRGSEEQEHRATKSSWSRQSPYPKLEASTHFGAVFFVGGSIKYFQNPRHLFGIGSGPAMKFGVARVLAAVIVVL